jgi:phosphoenolpyruvate carboxylase
MAEASRLAYRGLVHEDPAFIEYFQAVTPVDVIERAQIGSRPLSHAGEQGVEALRAIPWMLSWSQSRHMLPGWYGAGTGLAAVAERYGPAIAAEMYRDWAFFESLVDDIEMALARADIGIAAFYDQLARPEHGRFAQAIRREFELTRAQVLSVKGCAGLLDSEPTPSARSACGTHMSTRFTSPRWTCWHAGARPGVLLAAIATCSTRWSRP